MWVKKDSFIIAVAYFFQNDWEVPDRSNLCRLFWRTVFSSLFILFLCGLFGTVFGIVGAKVWKNPAALLYIFGVLAAAALLVWGIVFLAPKIREHGEKEPKTLIGSYVRAVKKKICPVIEIKE